MTRRRCTRLLLGPLLAGLLAGCTTPEQEAAPVPTASPSGTTGADGGLAAGVAEAVAAGAVCTDDADEPADPPVLELLPAAGEVALVQCWQGPYQGRYAVVRREEGRLLQLAVQQWRDGRVVEEPALVGLPEPDGDAVVSLERDRGAGDCGTWSRWSLSPDRLVLRQARVRACDDAGDGAPPETWPVVFAAG